MDPRIGGCYLSPAYDRYYLVLQRHRIKTKGYVGTGKDLNVDINIILNKDVDINIFLGRMLTRDSQLIRT